MKLLNLLSVFLCNIICFSKVECRLLAHGHYLKSTDQITICPDPNHCQVNPKKPLYLIWAKHTSLPALKLQDNTNQLDSSKSIEMQRPYRLDVWSKFTPLLLERIQESFENPEHVASQDVIITSFTLGKKVNTGDHLLWFIDSQTNHRYQTVINCYDVRSAKNIWQKKRVCIWKK